LLKSQSHINICNYERSSTTSHLSLFTLEDTFDRWGTYVYHDQIQVHPDLGPKLARCSLNSEVFSHVCTGMLHKRLSLLVIVFEKKKGRNQKKTKEMSIKRPTCSPAKNDLRITNFPIVDHQLDRRPSHFPRIPVYFVLYFNFFSTSFFFSPFYLSFHHHLSSRVESLYGFNKRHLRYLALTTSTSLVTHDYRQILSTPICGVTTMLRGQLDKHSHLILLHECTTQSSLPFACPHTNTHIISIPSLEKSPRGPSSLTTSSGRMLVPTSLRLVQNSP
jgi:hypothetical protein